MNNKEKDITKGDSMVNTDLERLQIEIAKEQLSKDHPSLKYLENAETSMDKTMQLTKQLLTFAKGGLPNREDVRIEEIIKEVIRFDIPGGDVNPIIEYKDDLWKAKVDKGQIQQIFSTLIINARQAMSDGGNLHIILENADVPENSIPNLNKGKYIKIRVRDEGIGIDKKHLSPIFYPCFSTKYTGGGLGLALTYSIIKKHNGHINIDSELGKGTTITIYLPASVAKLREKTKQPFNNGGSFDIVVMDLIIPNCVGGKIAAKNILEIDPKAKIIVSSGYSDEPVMANYSDYGFKGALPKPYKMKQLEKIMSNVLNSEN